MEGSVSATGTQNKMDNDAILVACLVRQLGKAHIIFTLIKNLHHLVGRYLDHASFLGQRFESLSKPAQP
jgi:hypothetical protein